jgi:hypothetical protein
VQTVEAMYVLLLVPHAKVYGKTQQKLWMVYQTSIAKEEKNIELTELSYQVLNFHRLADINVIAKPTTPEHYLGTYVTPMNYHLANDCLSTKTWE